jgi:TnpA family transposase
MARGFLSVAERDRLSNYPTDVSDWDLGRFFTLTANDLAVVEQQRGSGNRLGFALQLCTLRYLGFIPDDLMTPPTLIVRLLAHQLGLSAEAINDYGQREQTRTDHLAQIIAYLQYRRATDDDLAQLENWLVERALEHDQPTFLLHTAAEHLRWEQIIRPGLTVLERIVSTARQNARKRTYKNLSHLFHTEGKLFLDSLLEVPTGGRRTPLAWLQRMPTDHTATQINTTLAKIRFLQEAGVDRWDLSRVNPNRLKFLAGLGSRSNNQQLQRATARRRYPVLTAFLKQTLLDLTDIVIDLFDASLWELRTKAKAELDEMRLQAARSTNEKLRTYKDVVSIVMDGTVPEETLRATIFARYQRQQLQQLVTETESLIRPHQDEAIDLFAARYGFIRRYAPTFLKTLTFHANKRAKSLLKAATILQELNSSGKRKVPDDAPTDFITDAWWAYLTDQGGHLIRRYYELAVLWELRLALRAGDIYVEHARRHADPNTYLIPPNAWPAQREEVARLTQTPINGAARLQEREAQLNALAERVEPLFANPQSWLHADESKWILSPLQAEGRPKAAEALEDELIARLPRLDLTDLLIEVDAWTGFSRQLRHASLGTPAQTEIELTYLYAALLTQGCNFSLAQMSRSSHLTYHRLVYSNDWFIQEETLKNANAALVNYHHQLDISRLWGMGTLSSSDGQRLPVSGRNRKARTLRRYFGYRRGVTFYTWTSDQFSLYGGKAIASTVRDATYVLDEILANETELPILEHSTDTSGYTEIIFALFDLLGLTFTPRIKDLASQQLYRTENMDLGQLPYVRARLSKRVDISLCLDMWDEFLRMAGSLKLGWVTASLAIQRMQASSRKSHFVRALQEYGRLIKTIHALAWYESEEKRRWANRQLNKGESVHALKAHLIVANRGIIGRKSDEGLQHQMQCLNLLTNAIIVWNSVYMAEALRQLTQEGYSVDTNNLRYIWPTRFKHINVYGRYQFNLEEARSRKGLRTLRDPDDIDP